MRALAGLVGIAVMVSLAAPGSRAAAAPGRAARPAPRPAVIYLNADGGPVRGGRDSPTDNRASALGPPSMRAAIPPFSGSPEQWKEIVACVRQGFAPFAVDITTSRPAKAPYSMIMVGGSPAILHKQNLDNLGGYAPVGDGAERALVGFVFPETVENDSAKLCQAILHESGHLLGLDHVYACEDPMSYYRCGTQRFLEREEPCGESEPRLCRYPGGATRKAQSSAALLAEHVGWRGGVAPERKSEPPAYAALPVLAALDEVFAHEATPDATAEAAQPESHNAAIVAAADAAAAKAAEVARRRAATAAVARLDLRGLAEQPGGTFIELVVVAHSDRHIADVALQWTSALEQLTFACADLATGKDPAATCHRQGDVFTFRVRAGTGQRLVRALALDGRDMWLLSGAATLTFTP